MKYEKKELNTGVNERRGIVKLRSEINNDFKKNKAENTLIKIKMRPGSI